MKTIKAIEGHVLSLNIWKVNIRRNLCQYVACDLSENGLKAKIILTNDLDQSVPTQLYQKYLKNHMCTTVIIFHIYVLKNHEGVIKWKHFPRYWPFVRGIHRSPVNFPHKGQWRGASMFSSIYAWRNSWVNNREPGDLRRYRAHYDVTVMCFRSMDYIQLKYYSQLKVTEDCKQSIGTRKVMSTVTVGLNKTCHGLSLNVWNISCKIIISYLYVTTMKWEHRVM